MEKKEKIYHTPLTRDQVATMTSERDVERAESINCEPTSRLIADHDGRTEWSASYTLADGDKIIVYYYTTPEDDQVMDDHDGDGSCIDWTVDHYVIAD